MAVTFPLNAWYAAAWDVDLKHALFSRTICGKHVVMYRQSNGQVCALEERLLRLVPLSKGRLDGDMVVCGYHGLKFNAQGRLHLHALAGNHQSLGLRALLSGGRTPSFRVAVDGRSGAG